MACLPSFAKALRTPPDAPLATAWQYLLDALPGRTAEMPWHEAAGGSHIWCCEVVAIGRGVFSLELDVLTAYMPSRWYIRRDSTSGRVGTSIA